LQEYFISGDGFWFLFFSFFGWEWNLNSGLYTYKAGALLLEPHVQSILLWFFGDEKMEYCLPMLVSNLNPPNLCFPSS
jgi:hypothetical protein